VGVFFEASDDLARIPHERLIVKGANFFPAQERDCHLFWVNDFHGSSIVRRAVFVLNGEVAQGAWPVGHFLGPLPLVSLRFW
jgi:hypothetical protein